MEQNKKEGDQWHIDVRESAKYITTNASHVSINEKGIENLSTLVENSINNGALEFANTFDAWSSSHLHPKQRDDGMADWVFAVDTLNFSFWIEPGLEPYVVEFQGEKYSGYMAMVAAINRAIQDGIPITTPSYYSKVSLEILENIFRSETTTSIPMLKRRQEVLHEVGSVLCDSFNGKFADFIRFAETSKSITLGPTKRLLEAIITYFPCYRDECKYKGRKVSFYKRAQIVIGDMWACFSGSGLGSFQDIFELTMFADYRVPQALLYHGALSYSDGLMEKLKGNETLKNGSEEECELRGCSIEVVERVINRLKSRRIRNINAVMVDFFLWNYAKKNSEVLKNIPIHLVRCNFY